MSYTITGLIVVSAVAVCLTAWLVLEGCVLALRTVAQMSAGGGFVRADHSPPSLNILDRADGFMPDPPVPDPDSPLTTAEPDLATDLASAWLYDEERTGFTVAFPAVAAIVREARANTRVQREKMGVQ
jgi:hypothetical protein